MRIVWISILLMARSLSATTTQPATTQSAEQLLAQHKQQQREEYVKNLNESPELKLPTGRISDIFELTNDVGRIVVRPVLSATDGQVRCSVKGLLGQCAVSVFPERQVPGAPVGGLQFSHRDFSNEQEIFRNTTL